MKQERDLRVRVADSKHSGAGGGKEKELAVNVQCRSVSK